LVDTNFPWEKAAGADEAAGFAFVIGFTVATEKSARKILMSGESPKIFRNVFLFGRNPLSVDPLFILERLDEYAVDARDPAKLQRPSQQNSNLALRDERQAILSILGLGQLSEVKQRKLWVEANARLRGGLHSRRGASFRDFRTSIEASREAYACLLFEDQGVRNEFLDEEKRNVFGDLELIQNALFFGAELLSANYKHVGFMAELLGLKCWGRFPTES
jgi:hypothetical protein